MKKIRIVVLYMSAFSLFVSAFFNLAYVIFDKAYKLNNSLINSLVTPFASSFFVFLVMFIITLIWYLYHRKDRAESLTNGLILLMYLIYLAFFIVGVNKLNNIFNDRSTYNELYKFGLILGESNKNIWFDFSIIILVIPGMWNVISVFPLALHFLVSIMTNGYDNVPEPDNIYGFMYTIIGICYLVTMLIVGSIASDSYITSIFAFLENGLIMTITTLTFILCAGLRFNSVVLDIFNIFMDFIIVIVWIVIMCINNYSGAQLYLITYHLLFNTSLFVLSFFVLNHYILVDRFYKGITKNFLKE